MPTNRPVTAENMNYAVVILIGIFLFSIIYWYVGGARKHYIGPRIKHESEEKNKIHNGTDSVTRF